MMLIGIDHGNKQINYQDIYYTLSDQRIPYRKDKTDDERFFVLTLFSLAGELSARGSSTEDVVRVRLAVGLPPAHFGAQAKQFTEYFQRRDIIKFTFNGKAYAAAATMLYTLMEDTKAVILDIGGFTADYLLLKNGPADLSTCDSLENGVIVLYNRIRSKANAELDILMDENDVDIILKGKGEGYPQAAVNLVEQQAQQFVNDLFSTLRERMLDLRFMMMSRRYAPERA